MSEYESDMLRIERQRNRLEMLKIVTLPATFLITVIIAWLEITSANERSQLESMGQFEPSILQTVVNANNHCLLKDSISALYEHHINRDNLNENFRWYVNLIDVLEKKCEKDNESNKA